MERRCSQGTRWVFPTLFLYMPTFHAYFISVAVLPPIPTADLTPSDIPALASRVREQMLLTLREISATPPPLLSNSTADPVTLTAGELEALKPSTAAVAEQPPAPIPQPASQGFTPEPVIPIAVSTDIPPADSHTPVPVLEPSRSRESLASSEASISSSFNGKNSETEEDSDEGMVLVGRPL